MQKLLERFTKEQLIERLKHCISVAEKYPDLEEAQYDEVIFKIALAAMNGKYPVIPDGWKLVPLEATPDMLNEAWVKCAIHHPTCYRVMIAAAPQPE